MKRYIPLFETFVKNFVVGTEYEHDIEPAFRKEITAVIVNYSPRLH